MKIIIAHYHLNPGGVTRIIDSQIKSLKNNKHETKIEIVCGNAEDTSKYKELDIKVDLLPNLNYLQKETYTKKEINSIFDELYNHFSQLATRDDIIHFHNPNLGKNPVITCCLYKLASEGYKTFNHAHDFAEDRPENMAFNRFIIEKLFGLNLHDTLYPIRFSNYRFGVINSGDKNRLIKYKVPSDRISYLPNPVNMPQLPNDREKQKCRKTILKKLNLKSSKKIITYPVRVIRRKNIGELILLSELFKNEATFLVTLAPQNPVEIKYYNEWKTFCKENRLDNLLFEVNKQVEFGTLINGSDFCITTSVREGFGMTYMEPWLYDTPVIGRNIDYITFDFIDNGLIFTNLYDNLYLEDMKTDFKTLTMQEQMDVILKITYNSTQRKTMFSNNPDLKKLLNKIDNDIIEKNKSLIIKNYSFENYGRKILETYKRFFGKY